MLVLQSPKPKIYFHMYVLFLGLESLPTELQRNFNLMRDLDQKAQGMLMIMEGLTLT